MDRIERLDRSFMEPSDRWGSTTEHRVVIVPPPIHPMPDDEEARSRVASAMCRSSELRWLVEIDFAYRGAESRKRYPEAYL